jgi:cysteine desulfurase
VTRHYLDHASTSPVRPEAAEALLRWLAVAADPGRVHTEGRMVRFAVEEARAQLAQLVGARSREVIFTSGATEAVNTAVWGALANGAGRQAVAVAPVEHSCVRDASARYPVVELAVDKHGRIDVGSVEDVLRSGTVGLVHCQWANHEVATVQPVAEVVAACRDAGVLVHVDAAMAVGHVPVDFAGLGADLLSLSGHKFGGPPGTGALLVRRGLRLEPLLVGGAQERARRAGLENVPAIAGLGAAAAAVELAAEADRARIQTDELARALTAVDGVVRFGDPERRVPHLVCVGVEGVEAEAVLLSLDQAGVAAHSGSACSSESLEPSPVLAAMGVDAAHSLRLSVGWDTTDADVEAATVAFGPIVERLRALGR